MGAITPPVYDRHGITVYHGDCLDVLAALPAESVDAVVTDPPYLLGFMGRAWDTKSAHEHLALHAAWAAECLRVLKPGGHLLAFGGTRTWHRLACAIEDAGFEIRDSIDWLYGSGFPKSLDVGKAIDKAAGATPAPVGPMQSVQNHNLPGTGARFRNPAELAGERIEVPTATTPATDAARQWQGWGTALKPAHEPIVMARKPLSGTVAATVTAHGTGALNVDGCRVMHASAGDLAESTAKNRHADFGTESGRNNVYGDYSQTPVRNYDGSQGRWPSNVVLTHAPDCADECAPGCPVAELDAQSGTSQSRIGKPRGASSGTGWGMTATGAEYADTGGASRFFPVFRYQAKAASRERPTVDGVAHPTVKPLALLRWLVRLVTPPGGVVLDPFLGSGTTAEAARREGFRCIGIERDAEYLALIRARLGKGDEIGHFAT